MNNMCSNLLGRQIRNDAALSEETIVAVHSDQHRIYITTEDENGELITRDVSSLSNHNWYLIKENITNETCG